MLFFSATSASSIIISPDFSLLSFQYDIDGKNLTCLGLPHAFPCPRVVYMLPAKKPLCPRQLNRFIARTFSIILGSSFKLYNRFCSPSVLLFYLLEEISMCNNLSFKQLRYYEMLIVFLFLGLIEGFCRNMSVTKDCPSFLKGYLG